MSGGSGPTDNLINMLFNRGNTYTPPPFDASMYRSNPVFSDPSQVNPMEIYRMAKNSSGAARTGLLNSPIPDNANASGIAVVKK